MIYADVVIIGAGAAGLTAAQYLARAALQVLVIEERAPGGQAALIEVLENFPGNIASNDRAARSGSELMDDMYRQAQHFGAQFLIDTVQTVQRGVDGLWQILRAVGEPVSTQAVIVATGTKHKTLNIAGEKELTGRGVSYCASCDGPFFKGKKIVVVGGGDSACTEAQYLSGLTDTVLLVHRRGELRAQKGIAERVIHNPHIALRFNTVLVEIRGENRVSTVLLETDGKQYEEHAEAVFVFIGAVPSHSFLPALCCDEEGYIVTDQTMASSLPGLFAAGDVRANPFRQVIVAAGEGAVAAHSAVLWCQNQR
ncbi:MAG: FAD-dependent oxidoreductase [Spirochaetaceae bacterium]|jgi:thioredoxin reductase (NADPH)|nr:FAD-dependent oxidoreductase [Spirochaetaceae bacterium]